MKKILVLCLMLSGAAVFAQRRTYSKAPDAVRVAFNKQFQRVDDPRWVIADGKYEARFRHDGQQVSALYEKDGTWIETERKIPVESLPAEVKLYIEKNFSGRNAREASVIKLANGETNYEAHINYMDLVFDQHGKYLRSEKD